MKYLKLSTLFTAFAFFLIGCNKNVVVPVAGVSLAPESLTIGLSEDNLGKFDLIFTPKDASNKNVTWSSSNPEVASVSPDGIIKGLKQGQTAITVTTEDGGFTASNIVNVTDEITNDFDPLFRQLLYNEGYIKTTKEKGCFQHLQIGIVQQKVEFSQWNRAFYIIDRVIL